MKTFRLPRRFLPATLFLVAAALRAESNELAISSAEPPAETAPAETVSGPELPDSTASAPEAPKLSPKEQELLKRFDKNGDGKLDDSELAAAHEALHQEEMGKAVDNAKRLYARLLAQFDTEKKGSLTPAQQAQAVEAIQTRNKQVYAKLLQRFDKNGDGKLDADETQAMFTALAMAPKAGQAAKDLSAPAANPTVAAAGRSPGGPGGANRAMMARRIYDRLLAKFDSDKTGSLSPAEQAAALAFLKDNNPMIYNRMVSRFDTDQDGSLNATESQALFDSLAKLPAAAPVSATTAAAAAPGVEKEKS